MLGSLNSRRDFLKKSSVITAGTLMLPSFLQARSNVDFKGKRLVVVQLSGGNDGLNTVIPFRNDRLYKARPMLTPGEHELHKISDEAAFNPAMGDFKTLYEQGDICILNNVGYPNPNRSHFRSMDVWHTASNSDEYLESGWLGRYLDSECTDKNVLTAIEMGNLLSLSMKGKRKKGIPFTNVYQFYQAAKNIDNSVIYAGDNPMAEFLYKTKAETKASAEYLFEKNRIYKSKKTYPQNYFANHLKQVAQMIISGVESPVYYVSLAGFDTHNNQSGRQERLLKIYSESMKVFVEELKASDEWNNTLVMTFSEFGRRVKQNASQGTDHGKANNLFIAGGNLKKQGIYNGLPSLEDLDEGDIKHEFDFRQVYSTVLDGWLDADADLILGKSFDRLGFV